MRFLRPSLIVFILFLSWETIGQDAHPIPPAPGFVLVASDNCGAAGAHPNLVQGSAWTITEEERAGAPIDDPRLRTFSYGPLVHYRYTGLKADARYRMRILCFNVVHPRTQRIMADAYELAPATALPIGEAWKVEYEVPADVVRKGSLDLRFHNVPGTFGALVSAIELWSDTPGLQGKPRNLVRFRIDEIPDGGVSIGASLKIHRSPWNIPVRYCLPDGKIGQRALPHMQAGFTPWYDLDEFQGFGGECSLLIALHPAAKGATQFAAYPRDDAVIREIPWDEPDGLRLSFTNGIGNVRTFRDHERANYRISLQAGKERLYPLARPPLRFANAWGYTTGGAAEYMVKSFRLMGFNSVTTTANAGLYSKLYGWDSAGAQYQPPLYFPGLWGIVDEPTAAAMYDSYYQKLFANPRWNDHQHLGVYQLSDEPKEVAFNDEATANAAFREWAADQGLQPDLFGATQWDDVKMRQAAGDTQAEKRLYYWSRRFRAYATPKMFAMAAASVRKHAPGTDAKAFVALSGHHFNMESRLPLDMFQLAAYPDLTPGISDWMTAGSWWWDSHQSVAFSVAPYNAGARRYGEAPGMRKPPASFPMMHNVNPSLFRAFTQLGNQTKLISYYNYGPSYEVTEGYWSGSSWAHFVVQQVNNQAAQVDDLLGPGVMRPSRTAMLYSMANEIWWPGSSFADKRATFLALSHDYYQPELLTDEFVENGALAHYDALYVLDSFVSRKSQDAILAWVQAGGMLWTCSEALVRDEYGEQYDVLRSAGLVREFGANTSGDSLRFIPEPGQDGIRPHTVPPNGRPHAITWEGADIHARYGDGVPAWVEKEVGKGRIIYLGHRAGLAYSQRAGKRREFADWPEDGRVPLVRPLLEAEVARELTVSIPLVMAHALTSDTGTVIVVFNMHEAEPENISISLREPKRPASVRWFDENKQEVDLPFTYADGTLTIPLSRLPWQGNMIAIRHGPPPEDDRIEQMRTATVAQLAAEDWQALSAGAWTAGFYPEWELADKLPALLAHSHWAVRRSAAESLGRLGYGPARDALREAAEKEADQHVLADITHALARLRHPDAVALYARLRSSDNPVLREEARQALPAPAENK